MSSEIQKTRLRILDATCRLLSDAHERGVRMADIAKESGISRQAVYLHFPNRGELLIAAVRHLDAVHDTDARLAASRSAPSGLDRLDRYIEAWAGYIPEIYGVVRALLAMKDTDREVAAAWEDRMGAFREGCAAAVEALSRDGQLSTTMTRKQATDLLWTLLSIRNWEHLIQDCGWSERDYLTAMKDLARKALVKS